MLQGFVDDSKSEGEEKRLFLAGYIHRIEDWKNFSDAWAAALREDRPLKSLHMTKKKVWRISPDAPLGRWVDPGAEPVEPGQPELRIEDGAVVFYVEDVYLRIPYRVSVPGLHTADGEVSYTPLPMRPLHEPSAP